MTTTDRRRLVGRPHPGSGYLTLLPGTSDVRVARGRHPLPVGTPEVLVTLTHLSDLHVCDAQSPARVEMLDRWGDPDSPIREEVGEMETYRPQELMTGQVLAAMVGSANRVCAGPVAGAPVDLAVITGDNTDNAQCNELEWYLTLLEGGSVRVDSGDPLRWEGVAAPGDPDERYWHPEGSVADLPRSCHGFPTVPGLLNAVRRPFDSEGLHVPWLAVHGNHDRLVQGMVPGTGPIASSATGGRKPRSLPPDLTSHELVTLLAGLAECEPGALGLLLRGDVTGVVPDVARRIISPSGFVAAHDRAGARPPRHGFGSDGRLYYRHDHGPVRVLVLDTVNPHGGWQGSVDPTQLAWLCDELTRADQERAYVVLASHHPSVSLVNGRAPEDEPSRVLGPEVDDVISRHPSVVLWLNGHTHRTTVTDHGSWWEVTSPSLIDWPQQARVVEVLRGGGTLVIAATMLDHDGEAPWSGGTGDVVSLAGLSRELAANDWQRAFPELDRHPRGGTSADRNVLLTLADPWT